MTKRQKRGVDPKGLWRQREQARDECNDRIVDELRRLRTKIHALEALETLIDDAKESCQELFRIQSARWSVENGGTATPIHDSFLR